MINLSFSDISVKFIKLTFKSRFLMAKTCRKVPLVSKIVDKLLFDGDDIQVLPRDGTAINLSIKDIQVNKDIPVTPNVVLPSEVLREVIKRSNYHFIMNFCICRVSSDCKDYPHELGCLFLGRGTQRISSKLGRVVSSDEAIEHIERCNNAGLLHIIGRNKIDSVWLNTGSKEDLLSICSCCPCCCLWKMTPDLPENISNGLTSMMGVELDFNNNLCCGCGKCASGSCFVNAITLKDGKAVIDEKNCRVCGRCAEICRNGALTVLMTSDAIIRSIERIDKLVDVKSE
jgi:ferredoxin